MWEQFPSAKEIQSRSWEEPSKAEKARSNLFTERDGASMLRKSPKRRLTVWHKFVLIFQLGTQVQIPIHPSKCLVTQLKLDKDRKALLERKKRIPKQKLKHKEGLAGMDWSTSIAQQCLFFIHKKSSSIISFIFVTYLEFYNLY